MWPVILEAIERAHGDCLRSDKHSLAAIKRLSNSQSISLVSLPFEKLELLKLFLANLMRSK